MKSLFPTDVCQSEEWIPRRFLQMVKLQSCFGLPIDLQELINLKVPLEVSNIQSSFSVDVCQSEEWTPRQFLQLVKLHYYFGLPIDLREFYSLNVPEEDFTLFLQVIALPDVEINRKLLGMIKRNLPKKNQSF